MCCVRLCPKRPCLRSSEAERIGPPNQLTLRSEPGHAPRRPRLQPGALLQPQIGGWTGTTQQEHIGEEHIGASPAIPELPFGQKEKHASLPSSAEQCVRGASRLLCGVKRSPNPAFAGARIDWRLNTRWPCLCGRTSRAHRDADRGFEKNRGRSSYLGRRG